MNSKRIVGEIGITGAGMTRREMLEALERCIDGLRRRARRQWSPELDEEIDYWETLAAREYSAMTGVTDDLPRTVSAIAALIRCLDAGEFYRYLASFPPQAIIGIGNDPRDCPLHRFLVHRLGIHSAAIAVGLDTATLFLPQAVEAYDQPEDHVYWGDTRAVCQVPLPAWAAHVSAITSEGPYRRNRAVTAGELRALLPGMGK